MATGGDFYLAIDTRLQALSRPVRLRIFAMVTAQAVSATEVADVVGVSDAGASYHLRQLAPAGLVGPVERGTQDAGVWLKPQD